jgi:hypothetical protein
MLVARKVGARDQYITRARDLPLVVAPKRCSRTLSGSPKLEVYLASQARFGSVLLRGISPST